MATTLPVALVLGSVSTTAVAEPMYARNMSTFGLPGGIDTPTAETLPDGTLAGADLTLPDAVARLVRTLGISEGRALRMASAIPAALIGRAGDYGRVRPGTRAEMLLLDRDMRVTERLGF